MHTRKEQLPIYSRRMPVAEQTRGGDENCHFSRSVTARKLQRYVNCFPSRSWNRYRNSSLVVNTFKVSCSSEWLRNKRCVFVVQSRSTNVPPEKGNIKKNCNQCSLSELVSLQQSMETDRVTHDRRGEDASDIKQRAGSFVRTDNICPQHKFPHSVRRSGQFRWVAWS